LDKPGSQRAAPRPAGLTKPDKRHWLVERFVRLSTGLKMLLALSLALLPLGLIAILASIEGARQSSDERASQTRARLEIKAQRINAVLARSEIIIGAASVAISTGAAGNSACRSTLGRLESGPVPALYALYADGDLRCASSGLDVPEAPRALGGDSTVIRIATDGGSLSLWEYGANGVIEGHAQYEKSALAALTLLPGTSGAFDLTLSESGRAMVLRDENVVESWMASVRSEAPVAGGRLKLTLAMRAPPMSAVEILMILLPVMMWLAAGTIGWLVTDRLLLRPLLSMERSVAGYRPGAGALDVPRLTTPAREINSLARAFKTMVRTVSRHEANLEAGMERQTRLVREVHHRVKNNLQVVASLLNLHARSAPSKEVAAAYASIQRRVDALAVVHRNHFAELEDNKGVALKALIGEIAANLRATAPEEASNMGIALAVAPFYASQDVAVSVAFFITELVEFAMLCGGHDIAITLEKGDEPDSALLIVESLSLRNDSPCDRTLRERFERIVTGLSRQLRSRLAHDAEEGRYCVTIAVTGAEN